MTNAKQTPRRRAEAADGTIALRWDGRTKRWEVTFTNRQGVVLASAWTEATVAVDRVTASVSVAAVRDALEGMLPF